MVRACLQGCMLLSSESAWPSCWLGPPLRCPAPPHAARHAAPAPCPRFSCGRGGRTQTARTSCCTSPPTTARRGSPRAASSSEACAPAVQAAGIHAQLFMCVLRGRVHTSSSRPSHLTWSHAPPARRMPQLEVAGAGAGAGGGLHSRPAAAALHRQAPLQACAVPRCMHCPGALWGCCLSYEFCASLTCCA